MGSEFMAETGAVPAGPVDARCPYLQYRHVLGADYVAGVLAYAVDREHRFRLGGMHDRQTHVRLMDLSLRHSLVLKELGRFAAPIKSFVATVAAPAIRALNLTEPGFEPKEFEITAYPDGGRIGDHVDVGGRRNQIRILSCVYYFSATPRQFSGGELRLYGFPKRTADGGPVTSSPHVDIEPETDTLVVFPSWLRHEVRPVQVPSGAWRDSRFTINCWIHRMPVSAAEQSRS